ncbi:Growth_factor receptor cysteine-rich domain superfamily [Hexamita inflata]|uniref:Growth factor receptor cysteine-rich domain superfamily n=1 Tax=Hexamita inflata TaxID=28002 RepID=A0AA86UYL7_9EUKA|nr:Growth factor receptor cysteine-rich domain superfamily [Hexamita inflata]
MIFLIYSLHDSCQDEYCCRMKDHFYHFIEGKCQSCPEFYDFTISTCTTCREKYGIGSYNKGGECVCAPGMAGYESKCVDCWSQLMIVRDQQCVQCSAIDKLAIYSYQDVCQCTNTQQLVGDQFRCQPKSHTVLILSIVIPTCVLMCVIVTSVLLTKRKKKLNAVEKYGKLDKEIQSEQPLLCVTTETLQIVDDISSQQSELELQVRYENSSQLYLFNEEK